MRRRIGWLTALIPAVLLTSSAFEARAQFMYPDPLGGFGWGGWGNIGGTVGGDMARGLGAFATGAGVYNHQTAVANSIDADTVMRWNQFIFISQQEANRQYAETVARREKRTKKAQADIDRRLRENPEQRDIDSGTALNVAVDEITDPRAYYRTMKAAKVIVGGETVRDIPFQAARAGITSSIHQLTKGEPPKALMSSAFDSDRAALKAIHLKLRSQLENGGEPDAATISEAKKIVETAHAKAVKLYPKNSRDLVTSERYLKALLGLIDMLDTPALSVLLAGVETHPEITLDQLLMFMNSFNLRFGQSVTPKQRAAYAKLYPMLKALRVEVAASLAKAPPIKTNGHEAEDLFSAVSFDDLEKKADGAAPKKNDTKK